MILLLLRLLIQQGDVFIVLRLSIHGAGTLDGEWVDLLVVAAVFLLVFVLPLLEFDALFLSCLIFFF